MSQVYITLKCTAQGWQASFQGGRMPQDTWLPLPFTAEAGFPMVKRDLEGRFPGCRVSASARQPVGQP